MKLTILDRVILSNILPKEGSFANLRLLRVVREEISFNEEENKLLKFQQDGNQLRWESKVVDGKQVDAFPERDFRIGDVVTKLIRDELEKLNDNSKLTEQHFSIYEKFVAGDSDETKP